MFLSTIIWKWQNSISHYNESIRAIYPYANITTIVECTVAWEKSESHLIVKGKKYVF